MFCGQCGSSLPPTVRFCTSCGAPVQVIQEEEQGVIGVQPVAVEKHRENSARVSEPAQIILPSAEQMPPEKNSRASLILIIIVTLAIIGAMIALVDPDIYARHVLQSAP